MQSLSDNELGDVVGGSNKVEKLCGNPIVKMSLNFAEPGVKELMQNKEFTEKLSSMDINNSEGIQALFKNYGINLSDKQVKVGLSLVKPFL